MLADDPLAALSLADDKGLSAANLAREIKVRVPATGDELPLLSLAAANHEESDGDEWYTPEEYIESARKGFGEDRFRSGVFGCCSRDLDTQCLSDGGSSSASSGKAFNRSRSAPLERGPTLRKLCLELPREEWLKNFVFAGECGSSL